MNFQLRPEVCSGFCRQTADVGQTVGFFCWCFCRRRSILIRIHVVLVVSMNSIHVLEDRGAFFRHSIHVDIMMLCAGSLLLFGLMVFL